MPLFELSDNEEWRDIAGFEGLYQVSSLGRILRLPRMTSDGRHLSAQLRAQSVETQYAQVELYKEGKGKMCLVHRLVAQAFIPNPENKPTVNHKDGNKLNNTVSNLEWATQQENNQHALRTGLVVTKPVKCLENNQTYMYGSIAEAELKLPYGSVYRSIYENCKVFDKYTFVYVNSSDYVKSPRSKVGYGKEVKCNETGQTYRNCKEAEKALGLYDTSVYNAIYTHNSISGYTFDYVDSSSYVHPSYSYEPHKFGKSVKVKCIETNKQYNSYAEAARNEGLSESSIANSVRQHRSAKGKTFIEIK